MSFSPLILVPLCLSGRIERVLKQNFCNLSAFVAEYSYLIYAMSRLKKDFNNSYPFIIAGKIKKAA